MEAYHKTFIDHPKKGVNHKQAVDEILDILNQAELVAWTREIQFFLEVQIQIPGSDHLSGSDKDGSNEFEGSQQNTGTK